MATMIEVPTANVNSVWCPPRKDSEEEEGEIREEEQEIREEREEHSRCIKPKLFRLKKPNQYHTKSVKREARERCIGSNVLLKTIQEYTSVKVVKKVREIISCKLAEVNAADPVGQTPLMYAVRFQKNEKCIKLIDLLIFNGANLNAKDSKGRSVIHLAIKHGNYTAAIHLIRFYPTLDLNCTNKEGETPLKLCIRLGESTLEVIGTLLESNQVNVNAIDYRKEGSKCQTALHLAAARGSVPILKLLLSDANIKIDHRDSNGQTPLHIAALNFHAEAVRGLLDAGADSSIVDSNGQTPAQLAALKFYGSGLETMNSFIGLPARKEPKTQTQVRKESPECSKTQVPKSPAKRSQSTASTQTDASSPTKRSRVHLFKESKEESVVVEEPEDETVAESARTSGMRIVEVTEDMNEANEMMEDLNETNEAMEDRSNWALVPQISPPNSPPPLNARTHASQPRTTRHQFFSNNIFRPSRPTVIAYSRIVRSPIGGAKRQTFYFRVRPHASSGNIRINRLFQPPRRF